MAARAARVVAGRVLAEEVLQSVGTEHTRA
jgi:hypothetical protein